MTPVTQRIKGILNSARQEHTRAVTERIDSVGAMKDVVPLTESLYAVAKVRLHRPFPRHSR